MFIFVHIKSESAVSGPMSPGAATPNTAMLSPGVTPSSRGRNNSFSLPFSLKRARSSSDVQSPRSTGTPKVTFFRKALSLDNPLSPLIEENRPIITSPIPISRKGGGIAFSTPAKEEQSSPVSFVFTPSPQSGNKNTTIESPHGSKSQRPTDSAPEKKGWFSNVRFIVVVCQSIGLTLNFPFSVL